MNRSIPDSIIDEVRNRIDIVDVINEYVPLKKKGRDWEACCPFHTEKTPSFKVSQPKQMYYCYGCGAGGDVFKFVMEKENIDFPTAVHLLAGKCNVIIPEYSPDQVGGAVRGRKNADLRERLFKLHEFVAKAYAVNLTQYPESPVAQYVRNRDMRPEGIEQFMLGASLGGDDIINKARKAGFIMDELFQSGIAVKSPRSGKVYDRFFNRLTFPIWNETGRVIGFSSRTIENNKNTAKYVNSPESPLFKKSNVLYALPLARKAFQEKGFAILCEGQLDVIAMHLAGFNNTVAPQGTAFTDEQCRILKRYTDTLYLMFDSDAAGQKAIRRAFEIALPVGFELKAVMMPQGTDPDDIYKSGGSEAIAELVDGAVDFFDYLLAYFRSVIDCSTPNGKGQVVSEMLPFIERVNNAVTRSAYAAKLALLLQVSEEAIFGELNKFKNQSRRYSQRRERYDNGSQTGDGAGGNQEQTPGTAIANGFMEVPPRIKQAESILLAIALESEELVYRMVDELPTDLISKTVIGRALDELIKLSMNGGYEKAQAHLIEFERKYPSPELLKLLAAPLQIAEKEQDKAINDCLKTIKLYALEQQRDLLKHQMRQTVDPELQQKMLADYLECEMKIKELL